MYKTFLLFAFCGLIALQVNAQSTTLSGQVLYDLDTLLGAPIKFFQEGKLIKTVFTDLDGNYECKIAAGIYDVEVAYAGFETKKIKEFVVFPNGTNFLNITVLPGKFIDFRCFFGWKPPLFEIDNTQTGQTFDAWQLNYLY